MSFKKPNLTAPRFRETRIGILGKDLYCSFRKKYPQYKDIPDTELKEIITTFNELLWKSVIENRDGSEFPEGLGFIFIGSCEPPKKFNNDIKSSIEHGVPIKHRNFGSDNFLAKIFYTNYANKYKFQHREIWKFKPIRQFKRAVSKEYAENWKKYLQIDNFANVSRIFGNRKAPLLLDVIKDIIPDNYNEFIMD